MFPIRNTARHRPGRLVLASAVLLALGALVAWWQSRDAVTTDAKTTAEFKIPMYIAALGYLSLFGGLTLLNMRAEIMKTRAYQLASDAKGNDADAANVYLWRGTRHRLESRVQEDEIGGGDVTPRIRADLK